MVRRSAVMPLLWEVQRAESHVSEGADAGDCRYRGDARHGSQSGDELLLDLSRAAGGQNIICKICSTISCSLAGSDEMYDFISEETGLVNGETDREGHFSIQKVECLGSCTTAPVLQVNDTYFERVSKSRCQKILDMLKNDEMPEVTRERGGDNVGEGQAELIGGGE